VAPLNPLIDLLLGALTLVVGVGTTISLGNRTLLKEISEKISENDARLGVLEEWRVNHERWKEYQIQEIKQHLEALQHQYVERRRRPRPDEPR